MAMTTGEEEKYGKGEGGNSLHLIRIATWAGD